jgi:hypothetical protein
MATHTVPPCTASQCPPSPITGVRAREPPVSPSSRATPVRLALVTHSSVPDHRDGVRPCPTWCHVVTTCGRTAAPAVVVATVVGVGVTLAAAPLEPSRPATRATAPAAIAATATPAAAAATPRRRRDGGGGTPRPAVEPVRVGASSLSPGTRSAPVGEAAPWATGAAPAGRPAALAAATAARPRSPAEE